MAIDVYSRVGSNGAGSRRAPRPDSGTVQLPNGQILEVDALMQHVTDTRQQGLDDRKRYEGAWGLATAFVAGRQWVGWDAKNRRIIVEPNPRKRERHTVNVMTQHFWTGIGKLYGEEFKPDMLFARDDEQAQNFTNQARRAFDFAWDVECEADELILDLLIEVLAYGTAAIRCRYNPIAGPYKYDVPVDETDSGFAYHDPDDESGEPTYVGTPGKPIMHGKAARAYVGDRRFYGDDVTFKSVFEGRLAWELCSPYHIIVPPGIPHERDFPHFDIERPALLEDVMAEYGEAADGLTEQTLSTVDLVGVRDSGSSDDPGAGGSGKLRGHCLLATRYIRPQRMFPEGAKIEYSQGKLLRFTPELPYNVNGERKAGVTFFKFRRLPRRFWAQGLIEPLIGPQRQRNRARSQQIEMKDKNLGRVYARKGAITAQNRPVGRIMELIEVKPGFDMPVETQGIPPGDWIKAEVDQNDTDIDMAAGLHDVSLGQAPRGVSAYSAFALLAEADDRRVGPILKGMRNGMKHVAAFTINGARTYWPPEKQIILAGVNDEIESFTFNASKLPEQVYFRFGTGGPPTPKSPAAMIQLVFDLFDRSVSSGRPLPLDWLAGSLKAGKPLPMPDDLDNSQQRLAELENQLVNEGIPISVHPTDVHQVHIPIHEQAYSILSAIPEAGQVAQLLAAHIQEHQQAGAMAQAQAAAVPGLQGPMGALGGPDNVQQNALNPADLADMQMGMRHSNQLSPMAPMVEAFGGGGGGSFPTSG